MENLNIGDTSNSPESIGGIEVVDTNSAPATGEFIQPKRGRGRPPKSGTNSGGNSGGSQRGGSGSQKQSQKSNSGNLTGIENLLSGIHIMLAAGTKIPELTLTPDEAKRLADAINEVQQHYDFIIDTKVMAWVGLATTCSMIYMPRIATYNMRVKNEEKKKLQEQRGEIDTESSQLNPTASYQQTLPTSNVS